MMTSDTIIRYDIVTKNVCNFGLALNCNMQIFE